MFVISFPDLAGGWAEGEICSSKLALPLLQSLLGPPGNSMSLFFSQIGYHARNPNMYSFRTFVCFQSAPKVQDISSQQDKAISAKKWCLTTKIHRKNNNVTWPHLQITKTCQVFACNGSMTLNKLKSNKYSLADCLGDFDFKENVHEVNLWWWPSALFFSKIARYHSKKDQIG